MANRIPDCEPIQKDETISDYGQRCLMFILATDVSITMDDAGLELAERAAILAATGLDMLETSRNRLSVVRHLIRRTQDVRRMLAAEATPAPAMAAAEPSKPVAGGKPVAVVVAPKPQPPAPAALPAPKPAPAVALGALSGQFAGMEF